MSLKEAMLELADQMDAEAEESAAASGTLAAARPLRAFARQIRTACKAAGDVFVPQSTLPGANRPDPVVSSPFQEAVYHRQMIEKAKGEFRPRREEAEEQVPTMRLCVGGGWDGCMTGADPSMPVGANTVVGGEVYTLNTVGELMFNASATAKLKGGDAV